MTKLNELFDAGGQSPWLDNLRRDWIRDGHLTQLVGDGIRGITSNPTIFAKAIEGQDTYDEQFRGLVPSMSIEDAYWELVIRDIEDALEILRPLHEVSGGGDGFVSLEVAPALANETSATVLAARLLHERIAKPNLLVKVPGTAAGIPALEELISDGWSINCTLIFSLERYDAVMEAYIAGLEARAAAGVSDLSGVHSVASFFVSRVDTEVDRRLEALAGVTAGAGAGGAAGGGGDEAILSLRGRAAVAQAQSAYQHFLAAFSGPRWERLAALGARVQRPLWASTSTKNPAYADLLYVDTLIGPDTVNTMPDQTIAAFVDHGTVVRTLDPAGTPEAAAATLQSLADAGVDMADVAATLEDEGVRSFAKSFDELLQTLGEKAATFT
jgi:transaldolase